MNPRAPSVVLAGILTLAATAAAVVAVEGWPRPRQEERAAEFQGLVGGLGFGPALDLSQCPFAFDPRLDLDCAEDQGPFPGGRDFCPHHACAIFSYPPLVPKGEGQGNTE